MASGLTFLAAGGVGVIGGVVGAVGARATEVLRRRDQSEDTFRTLVVRAGQRLRASEHALHLTLTASAGDHPPTVERSHELLGQVRDDGVELLAADDGGLQSQLFLSHDAALDTLRDAVQFYERASALRLEGDDYDNEVAVLLNDSRNAVTEYLHIMDQSLEGNRPSRRLSRGSKKGLLGTGEERRLSR